MPIYILKRYHKIIPTQDSIWHLGGEIAFHEISNEKAIARAQKQDGAELAPHGGLAILFDPAGKRLWETLFDYAPAVRAGEGSVPASTLLKEALSRRH